MACFSRISMIFMMLWLSGCGPAGDPRLRTFSPDLISFFYSFVEDAALYGIAVDASRVTAVDFLNDGILKNIARDDLTIGLCASWEESNTSSVGKKQNGATMEIYIAESMRGSPVLKALMYHELGHCVLGLEHGTGGAIMNPIQEASDRKAFQDWPQMLDDFFGVVSEE